MSAQGFPADHPWYQPRSRDTPAGDARMDLKEVESAFRVAGILLVEVEDLDDTVNRRALRVAGCLEDYIARQRRCTFCWFFISGRNWRLPISSLAPKMMICLPQMMMKWIIIMKAMTTLIDLKIAQNRISAS